MTETNQHTPGPWVPQVGAYAQGRDKRGIPFVWLNLDAPGHIGGMKIETHYSMPDDELAANARLIAAAPDLLAAARAIFALEKEMTTGFGYVEFRAIEAAIAKAEGC